MQISVRHISGFQHIYGFPETAGLNSELAVFSVPRADIADNTWDKIKISVLGNSNLIRQGSVVIALGDMFGYEDGMACGTVSSAEYKESGL